MLRRTGFKRPQIERKPPVYTPVTRPVNTGPVELVAVPKNVTYRNPKLLALARGMACVECGAEDGTVVSAHGNVGKGMSIKASDATLMFLCHRCHTEFDVGTMMSKAEKLDFAFRNNAKTLRLLLEQGLIDVKS